ncbi:hypothetical protein, partial [Ralstonia solanacearum]|uniref:hypothetical protein n=1 Tax=Ralstonia solanacearum TaxID=305 RepID=UPI001E2EC4DC
CISDLADRALAARVARTWRVGVEARHRFLVTRRLATATVHRGNVCLRKPDTDRGGPTRAIHNESGQCCGRVVDIARTNNLSC